VVLPALVLALAAGSAVPVRADNIDAGLIKKAPEIMKYLRGQDYKNIGVLHFQLKKGRGKATYAGGPINRNLAERLENALVMENSPSRPLGIIHDASAVVAAEAPRKHWVEDDPKQRAALFKYSYPLVWESPKVQPDAFLLGVVKFSEDMRKTTVCVACFDNKSEKEHEVCQFDVRTDRTILADSGISYVVSRDLVAKRSRETKNGKVLNKDGMSLAELFDDDAANNAKERIDNSNKKNGNGNDKRPSGLANDYLDFQIYYDDQLQTITGDANNNGELRVPSPSAGQSVEFRMKNKFQDDIGVVVFVNGTSTLEQQRDTPENCRRWILPANGKSYWVSGYYDENDVLTPFKIVGAGDDLIRNELSNKLGLIEVMVFQKNLEPSANTSDGEMLISRNLNLRPLSPRYLKKLGGAKKPKTSVEARALAYKHAGLKVPKYAEDIKSRDFLVPDPDVRKALGPIEQRDFPNPSLVATPVVIRYNETPGSNNNNNTPNN
jgi:hypothetical protein